MKKIKAFLAKALPSARPTAAAWREAVQQRQAAERLMAAMEKGQAIVSASSAEQIVRLQNENRALTQKSAQAEGYIMHLEQQLLIIRAAVAITWTRPGVAHPTLGMKTTPDGLPPISEVDGRQRAREFERDDGR